MPFMHGSMPLRRTFFYLQQGKVKLRDNVNVFSMGFHKNPTPEQSGARDFVYWNWAQLQYHNPKVQLVKHADKVVTPFARAYLNDGREVLFDLDGMKREEIEKLLAKTLGKTELVERREHLESIAKLNPADFGSKNERQCMCEVQGQHPCTGLLRAPQCVTGKYRWNHNLI
ncbi:Small ribosomal subunit protein mS25 [Caenorhabditis elegans]|uniref:Small ribosomal subunit protein mS25 n=1 Tax=Caenorhabditis elegans TaxID=6239 RepID=RT25_CAEEL|nr:Small ribosomal subunit protein mS25 [Caenorhabditis elegans]Q9N361.1 RecName: Full=Small ribosomal subunit protein mS25; AltName: Full=28S ribosomal protein S25, mitochondrial; Short=MRP-S25; Short=S25mt [Caenorhabditis elegans]CCD74058.1 Small ribosomal subunit protein mS25 [Caenorhabditis elegans]|eukprot:NP_500032.1 Probable 28S ribosomal protein S25, mitochondrial [Caenorhabditis elegans]